MVGILSFLQAIALEGRDNTCKGTKYAAFLTEINNKLCALNDVYSIYLILVYTLVYTGSLSSCIQCLL